MLGPVPRNVGWRRRVRLAAVAQHEAADAGAARTSSAQADSSGQEQNALAAVAPEC
jgi:hypothetical protein